MILATNTRTAATIRPRSVRLIGAVIGRKPESPGYREIKAHSLAGPERGEPREWCSPDVRAPDATCDLPRPDQVDAGEVTTPAAARVEARAECDQLVTRWGITAEALATVEARGSQPTRRRHTAEASSRFPSKAEVCPPHSASGRIAP